MLQVVPPCLTASCHVSARWRLMLCGGVVGWEAEVERLSVMATVALHPPRLPFTFDFVAARVLLRAWLLCTCATTPALLQCSCMSEHRC